jgi:hypothetical protein
MRSEFKRHRLAYFVLITGIIIFIISFLGAWPNHWIQRMVAVGLAVFYFLWGVLTHFKTKAITREVILEYGSVSFLAGLILFLITL